MDGNSPHDGRLEICQAGVWGTVCDYEWEWDRQDGIVACRQLGINTTGSWGGGVVFKLHTVINFIIIVLCVCVCVFVTVSEAVPVAEYYRVILAPLY